MRIRSVKPEFFKDRVTGRLPAGAKMLYVGLWCFADDQGRFEWEPDLIRAELYPFQRDEDVEGNLSVLVEAGRIVHYRNAGQEYGIIPAFKAHQHPEKAKESRLPGPDDAGSERVESGTSRGVVGDESGTSRGVVGAGEDRRGGDRRGVVDASGSGQKPASPAAPSPLPFKASQAALVTAFLEVTGRKYLWSGAKDTEGLKRILALSVPLAEIQARWRSGLRGKGWKQVSTVAQLAAKWNDLTPENDPHDALFTRLRAEAEREQLGEPGGGGSPGGGAARPVGAGDGSAPQARAAVPAAVGELLGPGWSAGFVQDGIALEPGAQRGGSEAAGALRQPGNDAGGNGFARPG